MKHYFEKATRLCLTVLTSLSICIYPVNPPDNPNEPGISICNSGDGEEELPLTPFPPKPD